MKDDFKELYNNLNPAQKEAVDAIEGPVMVIAGPGTGKTTILTLRIANILRKTDTPPHGILAITYTNSGVKAIRTKLASIIGARAHDVRIHTFHSFASSIIAEYPDHFLHVNEMRQMSDIEQESLVRSILVDPHFRALRPTGMPDAYVSSILRTIDDAKREAMTSNLVRQFVKDEIARIKKDESSLSTRGATKGQLKAEARDAIEKCEKTLLFADVFEKYDDAKREAKKIDYNDLLIELLTALRKNELLLRLIQERYLYIHIDEHQDTNDTQNFIISIIAEFFDTPNVFIVGDEKQAIYRFQGASVENFLLLKKKWPKMKVISLKTNYRSHQSILDGSFSMIEKNYDDNEHTDLRIRLKSADGNDTNNPNPIAVVTGENVGAMELYLVKELQSLKNQTVAIIVRRNRDLDRVIRLLESHGIPVSSERSVDIFSHPVGRIFFDLIDYLADSTKVSALATTLASGMWQLSPENSFELVRALRSGVPFDLNKKLPALLRIKSELISDSPVGFLIHAGEESDFTTLIIKDPSYVHVWRGIIALAESLTREGSISDPRELIKNMLAYRTSAESRPVKVTVGAPDEAIQAMTAHGSKGLEFDRVFIPYATEESWVGRARGASFILPRKRVEEHNIKDIRRLFYVALTRARKHVTILTALEESDGKILSPLRFITELDSKHTSHISLKRVGVDEIYAGTSPQNARSSALLNLAKSVIGNEGLSVTALNHFLLCPNKFLFLSVLKMPQAPSAPSEKGIAMHEALSSVWKTESRTVKKIQSVLKSSVNEYFDVSLLQTSEKEAARKELIENIPAVAKALETHFSIPKDSSIFTETWVETTLQIPIHGKLDLLIDTGDKALVFDYKTRLAMSVHAIKGETKNDTGDYWRQLIFYKILVESDVRFKNCQIIPSLVFVTPDTIGRCPIITVPISDEDERQVKKDIQTLVDSVQNGTILEAKCRDTKCEWCGMREVAK
ncbi:MAG: ATP-dependent DNA helicase [Candidatus Taylorbacteria bacterium]